MYGSILYTEKEQDAEIWKKYCSGVLNTEAWEELQC